MAGVKMTLTIQRGWAQKILSGEKLYEARCCTDKGKGKKLQNLEPNSKIAFHWYRQERLVATVTSIMIFDTIPLMIESLGYGKLVPGMMTDQSSNSSQSACDPWNDKQSQALCLP